MVTRERPWGHEVVGRTSEGTYEEVLNDEEVETNTIKRRTSLLMGTV